MCSAHQLKHTHPAHALCNAHPFTLNEDLPGLLIPTLSTRFSSASSALPCTMACTQESWNAFSASLHADWLKYWHMYGHAFAA